MDIYSQLISELSNLLSDKDKLYVLKGFNQLYPVLARNISNYLADESSHNYYDYDNFNIPDVKQRLFNMGAYNGIKWITYEQYLLIGFNRLEALISVHNIEIEIVVFNPFHDYFVMEAAGNEQLLEYFEADDESIVHQLYSNIVRINEVIVFSFNEFDSFSSKEVQFALNKIVNDFELDSTCVLDSSLNPEFFAIELYQMLLSKTKSINIMDFGVKTRNDKSIDHLRNSGFIINKIESSLIDERIDIRLQNELLDILKRKNREFNFKDILIYEEPALSKSKISVSQFIIMQDIVNSALAAQKNKKYKDTFLTAPTGSGKSVIFQIPAVYLAEKHKLLTIVITPLIGLMNDQIDNINSLTKEAATINSSYTPFEKEDIKRKVAEGTYSILYLSPETLLSNIDITSIIGDRKIGLVVVDEAHTVTTWGMNFRPDYWYLGNYLYRLRSGKYNYNFPIAAFTATATYGGLDDMHQDIVDSLYLNAKSYIGDVRRSNIEFNIIKENKKSDYLAEKKEVVIRRIEEFAKENEKTIVYFPFVNILNESTYDNLSLDAKKKVVKYYGNLDKFEKEENYHRFKNSDATVILATKAFGMGIDIPDVKNVYHYAPTGNLSDYVQEVGRAARDQSILGKAISNYFVDDYRYINQLYGMSSIKNYELKNVLQRILNIYKKKQSRNFLVSPEDFSHIFSIGKKSDDEIENRLKTVLLMIRKDFELRGFVPIIFKPRGIFTKGLFLIKDENIQSLRNSRFFSHMKLMYSKSDLKKQSGSVTTSYTGDVYQLNFKSLWEESFTNLSFGDFKRRFFTDELDDELVNHFIPKIILKIDCKDKSLSTTLEQLKEKLNRFTSLLDHLRSENKYVNNNDVVELMSRFEVSSRRNAELILDPLLDIITSINSNNSMFNQGFIRRNSKNQDFLIENSHYTRRIENIIKKSYSLLNGKEGNQTSVILDNPKKRSNFVLRSNVELMIGQLLELFGLADYTIESGNRPEFFIRVNSETSIRKVLEDDYYLSPSVEKVYIRHQSSVELMKKFFGELNTNEERWDFIEDYFLGKV